ncbi:MAG: agglutinin biogenesis protein MshP [Methylococcaceae bacterium]|nr:agglutinin biogenesis protein MshP [Methylococcaceae bacterium]
MSAPSRRQSGFSLLTAIFLVVVLGFLGLFMVRFSGVQQLTSVQDLEAARALQLAQAGAESAAYSVLQGGAACSPATTSNLSFPGTGLAGWVATVSCSRLGSYTDLGSGVSVFRIVSTACNRPASGGCPGSADGLTYVERRVSVTIAR